MIGQTRLCFINQLWNKNNTRVNLKYNLRDKKEQLIMKKTLILIPCLTLLLFGCKGNNSQNIEWTSATNGTVVSSSQTMQKYEVQMSLSNYATYLDISSTTSYNQTSYDFFGCLNYAFYDNVIITIKYTESSKEKTEDVLLNAGGNGHFNGNGKYSGIIKAASGKVIFWI